MASALLLEDGTSFLLLEDGTSRLRIHPADASQLSLRETLKVASATDNAPKDMLRAPGTSVGGVGHNFTLTASGSDIPISEGGTVGFGWYSERAAADTTLTGLLFRHYALVTTGDVSIGTLRVRVWIQGSTPEHPERLIADYTGGELPNGDFTVLQEWDLPLLETPTVVARGERLVCRLTAEPIPTTTMGDGEIYMYLFGPRDPVTPADVMLITEPAIPLADNVVRLYLRRTTTIGIGGFFDALPTAVEQAPATAVVDTFAGLGETQWTQTAGGSVIEWVSPRFLESWYFDNVDMTIAGSPEVLKRLAGLLYMRESSAAANASHSVGVFRRRGTVEVECLHYHMAVELPVAYETDHDVINVDSGGGTHGPITPIDFQPDDRLVIRLYLSDRGVSVVAGHTATLSYDGTDTQSYIEIFDVGMGLKDEADPDTPPTVPGADMMSGMGN